MTVQEQIAALEARLVAVEKRGVGPRGPAGPIDAAVKNAEEAARRIVAEQDAKFAAAVEEIRAVVADVLAKFESTVRETKAGFYDAVKNEVDGKIISVLHEYHLLEDGTPTIRYVEHQIKDLLGSGGK
jgi:hypothetical protein